ncbi:beta-N-acetylhexosaminidase, partial [Vibrio parahaemolyticus]|nr:beta-N-acetylhexosaminidase [Vibrio parahaemolyticus]
MGPLWVDVAGYELTAEDKEILEHPTVGGLILFTRNYHDSEQLQALTQSIRKAVKRPFLIGVDQEGGRVQRFREGFSLIPAADEYAKHHNGEELARMGGWLMAAELIAHDIDLSFAPVLDKGHQCKAIGNRSFGEDADTILRYSTAYMQGMKSVGMATTGKHFPGHGGVTADSHLETPYDERSDIFEQDMVIFKAQIDAGILDAMMPAHVIFPNYDSQPASGSEYWLKHVLRQQLGFKGLIFS